MISFREAFALAAEDPEWQKERAELLEPNCIGAANKYAARCVATVHLYDIEMEYVNEVRK